MVQVKLPKNLSHLLLTINHFGSIGFVDLVKASKLSKATVSKYLNYAKENEMVEVFEEQTANNRTLKKYRVSENIKKQITNSATNSIEKAPQFSSEEAVRTIYSNFAIDPYIIDEVLLLMHKSDQRNLELLNQEISPVELAPAFFYIYSNLIENGRKFRISQQHFKEQYNIKTQRYQFHEIVIKIMSANLGFYSFERYSGETREVDYFFLSKNTPIGIYIFAKIEETIELEKMRQDKGSLSAYKEWSYFTDLIEGIYYDLEKSNIVWPAIEIPMKALLSKQFITQFLRQMTKTQLNPLYIRKQIGNACFNLLSEEIKNNLQVEPELILRNEENLYYLQMAVDTAQYLHDKLSLADPQDTLKENTVWIEFNSNIPLGFCTNCGEPIKIYQNVSCPECFQPLDNLIKPDLTEIYRHRLTYLINQMKYLYLQEKSTIIEQDIKLASWNIEVLDKWVKIIQKQDLEQLKKNYKEFGIDFLNFIIQCLLKETWETLDNRINPNNQEPLLQIIDFVKMRHFIIKFLSSIKKKIPNLTDILTQMLKELYENIAKIDNFGSIYETTENLNEESLSYDQTESKILADLISESIILLGEHGSEQQIFEPLMLFLPVPQVKYFVYFSAAKANMLEMIRPTSTEIINEIFQEKYKNPDLGNPFPLKFIYLIKALHQFLDNESQQSSNMAKLTKKAPITEYQPLFFFRWANENIKWVKEQELDLGSRNRKYAQWIEIFKSIIELIEKFAVKDVYYIKKEILLPNVELFEVLEYTLEMYKNRKLELIIIQIEEMEPKDSPIKQKLSKLASSLSGEIKK